MKPAEVLEIAVAASKLYETVSKPSAASKPAFSVAAFNVGERSIASTPFRSITEAFATEPSASMLTESDPLPPVTRTAPLTLNRSESTSTVTPF